MMSILERLDGNHIYKEVFYVILMKHTSLGYAKNNARLDQEYYSIPESCLLFLCPYRFPARRKKDNNKLPRKMRLMP